MVLVSCAYLAGSDNGAMGIEHVTPSGLVGPDGRPSPPRSRDCPNCGAGPDRRVLSSGFGAPHDLCRACGHQFDERTATYGEDAERG